MNTMFKSPAFAEKCIIGATYRTTGSIYYKIVSITPNLIRAVEMNYAGETGKYVSYAPSLFESLFRRNCTWARYAYSSEHGGYVDKGRAAAVTLRLDRFVPTV